MTSPVAPSGPEPADSWAERTEQAVLRAQAAGTPEAWQEAAQAATVVSELALTMQVAADVRRSAGQLDEAAEEARRRAEEAGELAAEAQRTVQKTAQAAKEAADVAAAAARAATEAKQKAERATEAMPRVAARSNDAAQAAAAAKRKVQLVEEIVTRAVGTDTPEAWSEAHRSADRAMEQGSRPAPGAGS
jgi:methyl-accepting chemotaxis protein